MVLVIALSELLIETVAVLIEFELFPVTVKVKVLVPDDPEDLLTVSHDELLLAVQLILDVIVKEGDVCFPQLGLQLDALNVM